MPLSNLTLEGALALNEILELQLIEKTRQNKELRLLVERLINQKHPIIQSELNAELADILDGAKNGTTEFIDNRIEFTEDAILAVQCR